MQIKKKKNKDPDFALFNTLLIAMVPCTGRYAERYGKLLGNHVLYCVYNYWFQNLATLTKTKAKMDRIS